MLTSVSMAQLKYKTQQNYTAKKDHYSTIAYKFV